jgi:hypothetical protein
MSVMTTGAVCRTIVALSSAASVLAAQGSPPPGFTPIFNGRTLDGWHVSDGNAHGATPDWRVIDGVLVGSQQPPGSGGVLLSDGSYGDVEVYLEIRPDYGCDGGLLLRSDERGRAYQVMIDYLDGGNVGGIYGEGLEGVTGTAPERWREYWKANDWNSLRVRIEGAAPRIQVWLNDRRITDWTDTANHAAGGAVTGMLGLQVHGGGRWTGGGRHRFRAIAVRPL